MPKSSVLLVLTLIFALLHPALSAPAASSPEAAFHKLQALAGDWQGQDDQGNPAKTNFRTVAGNTAVMETLTAAGMEEMLTLYNVDGDGISLVHYCPTNNQPRMRAVPGEGEAKELVFLFQGATNLTSPAIGHEHQLIMQFQDKDHITERWTWRKNDRDMEMVFKFVRRNKCTSSVLIEVRAAGSSFRNQKSTISNPPKSGKRRPIPRGMSSCAKQVTLFPLRERIGASTIKLFSLATFPRRPSASQAVPGGATDSDNG